MINSKLDIQVWVGEFYGKLRTIQKWLNIIVGLLFIGVGAYYCAIMFF